MSYVLSQRTIFAGLVRVFAINLVMNWSRFSSA
jgi:hypothetical protein